MYEEDYKIKYLKYKQKYTNALQNMQGGAELMNALVKQPKAVYVLDKLSYDNLKILLGNSEEKEIKKYSDCVDMLVGISNKDVIKIKPMTKFKSTKTELKREEKSAEVLIRGVKVDTNIIFKDGLEKIDKKTPAPYNGKIPFQGLLFGENNGKYSAESAKAQLLAEFDYFSNSCKLTEPHIVVFGADNKLCLCGPLKPSVT
jgi:hypothetical protein